MTTDSQIDAGLAVFKARMPDVSPSREIVREMIEAGEKAAWRPIAEIPDDEMLMVLARNATGMQMVWRARMLFWQAHQKTPQHLQFGATEFRVIGAFDCAISGGHPDLRKSPSPPEQEP